MSLVRDPHAHTDTSPTECTSSQTTATCHCHQPRPKGQDALPGAHQYSHHLRSEGRRQAGAYCSMRHHLWDPHSTQCQRSRHIGMGKGHQQGERKPAEHKAARGGLSPSLRSTQSTGMILRLRTRTMGPFSTNSRVC